MSPEKTIRDVRIEAEMKTPSSGATTTKLTLLGPSSTASTDLDPGSTIQKIVHFDLKEEGNHVLAVTVSYYEAAATSGRTRTFRKLYQFICKAGIIVRTKPGSLPDGRDGRKRWVLEAQLENCGEDVVVLDEVKMDCEEGLWGRGLNWEAGRKPVLHPGEVEQVCFVIGEEEEGEERKDRGDGGGRVVFGVLGIGWRGEMGNRGFLSTGKLGTR